MFLCECKRKQVAIEIPALSNHTTDLLGAGVFCEASRTWRKVSPLHCITEICVLGTGQGEPTGGISEGPGRPTAPLDVSHTLADN